jgi:hypothetical protein
MIFYNQPNRANPQNSDVKDPPKMIKVKLKNNVKEYKVAVKKDCISPLLNR